MSSEIMAGMTEIRSAFLYAHRDDAGTWLHLPRCILRTTLIIFANKTKKTAEIAVTAQLGITDSIQQVIQADINTWSIQCGVEIKRFTLTLVHPRVVV